MISNLPKSWIAGSCFAAFSFAYDNYFQNEVPFFSWFFIGALSGGFFSFVAFIAGFGWYLSHCNVELFQKGYCASELWFLCSMPIDREPCFAWLNNSWLGFVAESLRSYLYEACLKWSEIWGPWALGLLSGRQVQEASGFILLYRSLGLLHVLVISGSHFTFLFRILNISWHLFPQLSYSARLIGFRTFLALHFLGKIFCTLLMASYAQAVSWQPPCQRAFLHCSIALFASDIKKKILIENKHLLVALLQSIFFPLNFFSLSNGLSWIAVMVIQRCSKIRKKNSLLGLIIEQEFFMALVSLGFFGFISPFGWILNGLLIYVWDALLILVLVGVFGRGYISHEIIPELIERFHGFLVSCSIVQADRWGTDRFGFIDPFERIIRILSWLVIFFMIVPVRWSAKDPLLKSRE